MSKREKYAPTIVEFQKEDAPKLAELFNSFDREGLWPGGFTGGVPYTAERILDSFPVAVKNICILVSTHNGKFTGICTLHPHHEDAEAAYIGLLGVHPDYLNKGHGKALILRSLQIATENNLRRVDLDTWAGNLRAVPLYKKCGMFWVPETSVRMQDYVPGIINFPVAKEFFKKYDWYSSQKRKLELVPDRFKLEEMEVFLYEFSEDEDHVKVWVDRYGRGILGIERTLDGEHLRIVAKLKDHKVIAGVEQVLTIEIRNDTKSNIQGSVSLSGFEGLNFATQPPQSFSIENGASIKLNAKFTVSPEAEVPDASRKQKAIKANLIINDELIPVEIGMRILPLLEFKTHPESIAVAPGTKGTIQFNVFNNSKERFTGNVLIIDELTKLSLKKTAIPIEIPPKSHSGFKIEIEILNDQPTSLIPLKLFAKGKVKGVDVKTKTEITYIKCLSPGGIVASVEETKQGRSVFVENEDLLACVRLREGLLEITYKDTLYGSQEIWRRGRFDVGPPFSFVKPIKYDYEVLKKPERLELVLSGVHPDKPGVKMMRILTFYAGASIIKERIRIVNMNPEVTYKLNVRISGRGFLENIHYTMIVPLEEIMEHEMIGFPVSESDLPTDPEDYKESWICFQNQAQNFCFGQVWSNEKLSKIRISDGSYVVPEYELGDIKPDQSACTSELYYVMERGNWQTIRRKWKSLIEKKLRSEEKIVEAKPLFNIKLAETILYDNTELRTQLKIVNFRNKGATGKIVLTPPSGWKIYPSEIEVKNVTAKNSFTADVSLIPPPQAELGIYSGTIRFSAANQEIQFPMDLCILSKTAKPPVTVVSEEEESKAVFKVSNGLLNFKTSAEFAGCLYFLGKNEVNQLATSFPKIGPKVFLENYSGGIRALYLDEQFDFQKSKTHEEFYKAEVVEEGHWKGIEFSFKSKQQEEIKGITGSTSYLTLPFSNIVKIKRKFKNPTCASFKFNSCLWISPNVGENFEKSKVIFPRDDKIFRFKRAEGFAVSGVQPERGWMLVTNGEKKLGLGIVAGNTAKSTIISLDLGKTMLELFVTSRIRLQPRESCELEDYVVLSSGERESMDKLAKVIRTLTG
jgi:ribosomal protein S18 acetylase RimI-like enzyme